MSFNFGLQLSSSCNAKPSIPRGFKSSHVIILHYSMSWTQGQGAPGWEPVGQRIRSSRHSQMLLSPCLHSPGAYTMFFVLCGLACSSACGWLEGQGMDGLHPGRGAGSALSQSLIICSSICLFLGGRNSMEKVEDHRPGRLCPEILILKLRGNGRKKCHDVWMFLLLLRRKTMWQNSSQKQLPKTSSSSAGWNLPRKLWTRYV